MASQEIMAQTRERQIHVQAFLQFHDWETEFRDLARYIMPKRYSWLNRFSSTTILGGTATSAVNNTTSDRARGRYILDSTGTNAARTLAAGLMNGITSPARPWVKFRAPEAAADDPEVLAYLEDLEKTVMDWLAQSNFYDALAVYYSDLSCFGNGTFLIYEDPEDIFRCYNSPLGEFAWIPDEGLRIGGLARELELQIHQIGKRFGTEGMSDSSKIAFESGGARAMQKATVCHLIERNHEKSGLPKAFRYVEYYWEKGAPAGRFLRKQGFYSKPFIASRWEVLGTDTYGVGPGHEALSDIIQLQHETKAKAQAIDKQVKPPMKADISLAHRPFANVPGGITFVAPGQSGGLEPAYTVNINLNDLKEDIRDIQERIRVTFFNDLFKMITQLDTVRSATEIDARREEKLVLLGPVLSRLENEGLEPALRRIVDILERAGIAPKRPEALRGKTLRIEYVSILADAQRAVATIGVERFLAFIGNVAAIWPAAIQLPNFEEIIRDYARAMGITGKGLKTVEQFAESVRSQQQQEQLQQQVALGGQAAQGAKLLSETDVGGGVNALQGIMGGM